MKVNKTIAAALLVLSTWTLAGAQTPQAQIVMSVPKSTFLAIATPSPGIQAVSGNPFEGRLLIGMRQQADGLPVRISVLARSNTAYRVTARISGNQGSASQLTVRTAGAEPNSGTMHVMPDALNVHFEPSFVSAEADTSILEGPRISKRGNATTPDNAIVLTFLVEMPKDLNDIELLLKMDPLP